MTGRGRVDKRQPERDEIVLDHIGYYVEELETAARQLERLGFTVSPIKVHQNAGAAGRLAPSGTANWSAPFEFGFIEALAATGETPLAERLRRALARYPGLHVIAFGHPDMAGQRKRLVASGFAMQEVVALRLPVPTPDGERHCAYSVLRTEPNEMPEGRVQMVTNHTPELTGLPGPAVHGNGVNALTDLLICVEDPTEAASRFGRFTDRSPQSAPGLHRVTLDRGRVLFVAPAGARAMLPGFEPPDLPYVVGLGLRTGDLGAAGRRFAREEIEPVHAGEGLICIGPRDGLGAYLLFHTASIAEPWSRLAAR